jgi:HEAT repeat protein
VQIWGQVDAESSERVQIIGRPFPPGVSGNPGGVPKGMAEVRALARTFTQEAIVRLADWMRSENPKASVAAASILLDRGWGKPVAAVEVSTPGGGPMLGVRVDLTRLSEDEFRTFRALAAKAKAQEGDGG